MIWLKMIAGRLRAVWPLLLSFMASAATFSWMRSRQIAKDAKREAKEKAEAFERIKKVMNRDVEIDLEFDEGRERLEKERAKSGTSSELSSPNEGWK